MIRIGMDSKQKEEVVSEYVRQHETKKVVVFSPPRFRTEYDCGVPVEYYTWDDAIMYRVFYPLLETIDDSYLIVCDEMMRKRNRSELTYNCLHHYQNQTPHRISFEYFPFIEDASDFMILLDFDHPGSFKGRSYEPAILNGIDLAGNAIHISATPFNVDVPDDAGQKYQCEKEKLFDGLGSKDPDTIPRALHIWCGKYKGRCISDGLQYVARNARYARQNVATYKDVTKRGDYIVLDFAHSRIDFNDFLKVSGMTSIRYYTTKLPVDNYYADKLCEWSGRLEAFYAQASIY